MDMQKVISVIGVDHHLQFGCCDRFCEQDHDHYRALLLRCVNGYQDIVVAEEVSDEEPDETLANYCEGVKSTIAQSLFRVHGQAIQVVFIDPGKKTRAVLGIKSRGEIAKELDMFREDETYTIDEERVINQASKPFDDLRERYWLNQLVDLPNERIVLVVGYSHVESIANKIRTAGVTCNVVTCSPEFLSE